MLTNYQRLNICKKCSNRKLDMEKGVLCGLTNLKPQIENTCDNYIFDKEKQPNKDKYKKEDISQILD